MNYCLIWLGVGMKVIAGIRNSFVLPIPRPSTPLRELEGAISNQVE